MTIKVGDTVTIRDEEDLGEYTVLAIHSDESDGWPEPCEVAWLRGKCNYTTRAVAILKRKPKYTVEFYNKEYPISSDRAPYYAKMFDSMDKVAEYLSKITIGNSECVLICKWD